MCLFDLDQDVPPSHPSYFLVFDLLSKAGILTSITHIFNEFGREGAWAEREQEGQGRKR